MFSLTKHAIAVVVTQGRGGRRGGGGGSRGHNLTFIKHTPKFVAQFNRTEAQAAPRYEEREEREDRDDEMPVVVDLEDAKASSKKRPPPPRDPATDDAQARLPKVPHVETTADRFRETPSFELRKGDDQPPQPEQEPTSEVPIRFNAKAAKATLTAKAHKGAVPRARKAGNEKLLSFEDP
jgi:hypothetical protein